MTRTSEKKDLGAALLVVMGLGMVMVLLITTGLSIALSGLKQASGDADYDAALDAAYAGVQDYLARVNADDSYTNYGNPASDFSASSAVKLPKTANPAFNAKAGEAWAAVPGSNGRASFRYEVDTSRYKSTGVVRIRSTGLVGGTTRSVLSNIRVRGFVDFIYFTDYEIQDPKLTGKPDTCVLHAWELRAASCGTIQFSKTDHLNGPVHSNDTLVICGARFDGAVTTANTKNPIYTTPSGCSAPKFGPGGITRAATLPMPQTNSAMLAETRSDLSNSPGCLYTGPTQVTYNSNGTMTVVSPWTRYTNITATSGSDPGECGSVSALHSSAGATVPQLDANLLYVQNVPSDPADPNYAGTSQGDLPSGFKCLGPDGSFADGSNVSAGWRNGNVQYPAKNEVPASGWYLNGTDSSQWDTTTPAYGCRSGDLFVQGQVSAQTTAASENYVYVTGDITYKDKNSDVLGLVGQNGVLVYNPLTALGIPLDPAGNREIDAAVISVAHTFQVQNFDKGPARGTLTLFGSLAQKFRGPVATSANGVILTGYSKNYAYDPLLVAVTPPKFLEPAATSFILIRYASVQTAFDASGAPQ